MLLQPLLLRLLSLYCLAVVFASAASAQNLSIHPQLDPRNIVVPDLDHPLDLTANWLVHQGDDPAYASPTLDDSRWTVIETARPLSTYGITKPDFLWYRTHVHTRPGQRHLAILLRLFTGSEQIYVNGMPTGPSRAFNAQGGLASSNFDLERSIPDNLVASGDLVIAIRAQVGTASAFSARSVGLSRDAKLLLGEADVLAQETSLFTFRSLTSNFINIMLTALVLLIALALALTLRTEPEHVSLCVFLAASLCMEVFVVYSATHERSPTRFFDLPGQILDTIMVFSGIDFARRILRLANSGWLRNYQWVLGSILLLGATGDAATNQTSSPNSIWIVLVLVTALIIVVPLNLGLPLFAVWIWRRTRNLDALLLSVPLLLKALFFYIEIGVNLINLVRPNEKIVIPPPPIGAFIMQWSEIGDFLFTLALLGFLMLRTVRLARARALLAAEFAAAQQVQQLLLVGSSRPTPGFRVETAFHPASQVGGDFFLLSPLDDGSLLAIVGDVSGKGLTAAMRVAMILGVLRRESSCEPGAILSNLNQALLSQSEMGFTTACCILLRPNGEFTAANAGHIAPYIAGVEFQIAPEVPLGLAAGQQYELATGRLAPDQTMVLMSDGVPEARNTRRELYGFDRLPSLTLHSAQEIAATALAFGQEDDITVLTLALT